jgi:hypothetical protein
VDFCSADMNVQMQEWLDDMEASAVTAHADVPCGLEYSSMCPMGPAEVAAATCTAGAAASAAAAQLAQGLPAPAFVLLGLLQGVDM